VGAYYPWKWEHALGAFVDDEMVACLTYLLAAPVDQDVLAYLLAAQDGRAFHPEDRVQEDRHQEFHVENQTPWKDYSQTA
jgi:hypothetical protein